MAYNRYDLQSIGNIKKGLKMNKLLVIIDKILEDRNHRISIGTIYSITKAIQSIKNSYNLKT